MPSVRKCCMGASAWLQERADYANTQDIIRHTWNWPDSPEALACVFSPAPS